MLCEALGFARLKTAISGFYAGPLRYRERTVIVQLLINIDVADLEKGIAFYENALGLRLARKLFGNVAEMVGATSPIYLLCKPTGSIASPRTTHRRQYERHWTPVHLDFVVLDIEVAAARAQAAGAILEGEIHTHQWGRIACMADPYGNGFCLIQFLGRGYDEIA